MQTILHAEYHTVIFSNSFLYHGLLVGDKAQHYQIRSISDYVLGLKPSFITKIVCIDYIPIVFPLKLLPFASHFPFIFLLFYFPFYFHMCMPL